MTASTDMTGSDRSAVKRNIPARNRPAYFTVCFMTVEKFIIKISFSTRSVLSRLSCCRCFEIKSCIMRFLTECFTLRLPVSRAAGLPAAESIAPAPVMPAVPAAVRPFFPSTAGFFCFNAFPDIRISVFFPEYVISVFLSGILEIQVPGAALVSGTFASMLSAGFKTPAFSTAAGSALFVFRLESVLTDFFPAADEIPVPEVFLFVLSSVPGIISAAGTALNFPFSAMPAVLEILIFNLSAFRRTVSDADAVWKSPVCAADTVFKLPVSDAVLDAF